MPKIDPFLVALFAAIGVASLIPARGAGADIVDVLSLALIVLMFFFHGLKLERGAIVAALRGWRFQMAVLAMTFVLFPLLGLGAEAIARPMIGAGIASGLLFLTLVPSTVQSSVAFTGAAGGNVAPAVTAAAASNMLGTVLTPLLAGLLVAGAGASAGGSFDAIGKVMAVLLLPFALGHLSRRWFSAWAARNRKLMGLADKNAITLIVYSAFSAAVVGGIWQQLGVGDLVILTALAALLLAGVTGLVILISRQLHIASGDRPAFLFCGTQKSLVAGVAMASLLFPSAQAGLIVLPLMIFHQLQLVLAAILAARWRV
ncbi:MAG: bile acid:sodium symporter family protein [Pacificimonas sp.]